MYESPKNTLIRPDRARAGVPLDLMRVALAARSELMPRWKFLGAGAVALCALALFTAPREFTSRAVLTWEGVGGELRDPGRELRTIADSVKTPVNLTEVRRQLALDAPVESVGRRIEVSFAERSNLLTLAATGKDPQASQALARSMLAVFLEQRLRLERARRERLAGDLGVAVDSAEKELAERRAAWEEFCRANNVGDLPSVMQLALGEGARLSGEQIAARAEAEAEGGRAHSLSEAVATQNPSVVLSQKVVDPTGAKLADVERELAGLRDALSADHPQILALEGQAAALRARPRRSGSEVATERSMGRNPQWDLLQGNIIEAHAREDAAQRRAAALAALADESSKRIGKLSEIEGKGSRISLALKSAEAHLAEVRARRAQALDEARTPSSGLSVISPPDLPALASKSSRKPLVLLALFLAIFAPLAVVVFRATRGLRAVSAAEVAFWGRAPVVASTAWPRVDAEGDLELDLAKPARASSGITLLAGFGADEEDLPASAALALGCPVVSSPEELLAMGKASLVAFAGDAAALRRALRLVDRVVVLLVEGRHSAFELALSEGRFSEARAFGYAIAGADGGAAARCGDVDGFWGAEDERLLRPVEFTQRRAN